MAKKTVPNSGKNSSKQKFQEKAQARQEQKLIELVKGGKTAGMSAHQVRQIEQRINKQEQDFYRSARRKTMG